MRRLHAYAQLLRLPNVFTALADICLGALAAGALPDRWPVVLLLLLASGCLYSAGMVWNDFFDVEQDRIERPFRPIPSGRVSAAAAAWLGTILLAAGFVFACLAGGLEEAFRWQAPVLAGCLVVLILLYDAWLKRTPAGPVAMGGCRSLNVLLGLSAFPEGVGPWGLPLALVVGMYVGGITWFARTEARDSSQAMLGGAAAVMLGGLLLALTLPALRLPGTAADGEPVPLPNRILWGQALFPYLLLGFIFYVGAAVHRALARPAPERVQAAVRRAVLGLVPLDAILATALVGPLGLVLVFLLVPALYLGRWLYST
jgi:4-hydroxybenzoate polyprenyltransferase